MSRAAKLTLAGTSLFAIGTIVFVHHAQQAEKAVRFYFTQTGGRHTNSWSGDAPGCSPGRGTAATKERTTARFRDAESPGGGIQENTKRP